MNGMNRAARRAAKIGRPVIKVSNRVDVVPMEHAESYLAHEIEREGPWRSGVPLVILQPEIDRGRAAAGWMPQTLARMQEVRLRHAPVPFRMDIDAGGEIEIDVGLVDVTVFFEMPASSRPVLPGNREEVDRLLTENLRHLDEVCAGALHDQMVIASAQHFYHSGGAHLVHFHNLIFGLRQEVRDDRDLLGPLDMNPLLEALAASGPLSVIGGMRPAAN